MTETVFSRFADALKTDNIQIYVGDKTSESTPYVVPKAILSKYRYLRNALSPPFIESRTGVLHFPEDTEDAWSVLLYYFFHGKVQWPVKSCARINLLTLTKAYVLADKYQLPALQNRIIRAIISGLSEEGHDWSLRPSDIEDVMNILPSNSRLRWVILEYVLMMVIIGWTLYSWIDFQGLAQIADSFADLLASFQLFHDDEKHFPPYEHLEHERDDDDEERETYFVEETSGPEDDD